MKNKIIFLIIIIISILLGSTPVMEGSCNINTSIIGDYGYFNNDLFD